MCGNHGTDSKSYSGVKTKTDIDIENPSFALEIISIYVQLCTYFMAGLPCFYLADGFNYIYVYIIYSTMCCIMIPNDEHTPREVWRWWQPGMRHQRLG